MVTGMPNMGSDCIKEFKLISKRIVFEELKYPGENVYKLTVGTK